MPCSIRNYTFTTHFANLFRGIFLDPVPFLYNFCEFGYKGGKKIEQLRWLALAGIRFGLTLHCLIDSGYAAILQIANRDAKAMQSRRRQLGQRTLVDEIANHLLDAHVRAQTKNPTYPYRIVDSTA